MHCRSTIGWYRRPASTFVAIGLANNGTTGSITGPADGQNSNGTEISVGSCSTSDHYRSAATVPVLYNFARLLSEIVKRRYRTAVGRRR